LASAAVSLAGQVSEAVANSKWLALAIRRARRTPFAAFIVALSGMKPTTNN
jgi:hypothetical protein